MRRNFFLLIVLMAVAGFAHAQAPKGTLAPHQASLSWSNGVDPVGTTITGSNVYRCSGNCTSTSGTFAVLNSAPLGATVTTYTDLAVSANTTYSWCVTNLVSISSGPFETACSNVFTALVPKDAAVPPQLNAPVTQ